MAKINGKVFDWNSIRVSFVGRNDIQATEITYSTEQSTEAINGFGGTIRGWSTGQRKNDIKISMLREDFDEIQRVAESKGYNDIYKFIWDKIVVTYADTGSTTLVDTIAKFKPTKIDFKASEGDTGITVEISGVAYGGIKINGMTA